MARKIIPDSIRNHITYNPDSGILTYISGKAKGRAAGYATGNGYLRLKHKGAAYSAHRVCWFLAHNEQPDMIDHINHKTTDNRLCNLRNVDASTNQFNRLGVAMVQWYFRPDIKRWYVRGAAGGKSVYNGTNYTTAWFNCIMAQRSTHPIALPKL
jgi:hypothetical protein